MIGGNHYLHWVHLDNQSEVVHIDNAYQMGDLISVFNQQQKQWIMATVVDIEMNYISVRFADDAVEKLHVVLDSEILMFPELLCDTEFVSDVICRENLDWTLLTVTPTPQNTLFQCMAYVLYGDLNLAIAVKRECTPFMKTENIHVFNALCKIYGVHIRVFGYNKTLDG